MMDTADGAFMNVAYGWAFSRPVRKVFYNLTITGLSVAVALLVGTLEVLSLVAQSLGLTGGIWNVFGSLDLNLIGIIIVVMFVVTWVVAMAVWRFGHIEERWSLTPTLAVADDVVLVAGSSERGATSNASQPPARETVAR